MNLIIVTVVVIITIIVRLKTPIFWLIMNQYIYTESSVRFVKKQWRGCQLASAKGLKSPRHYVLLQWGINSPNLLWKIEHWRKGIN